MIRTPHVVEGESTSFPSDTRTMPNRTPKTRVSVANTVTYLMNLGKSRRTRSRRDGGGSSLVDGPRTIARNIADPIQPIAASMCNQARTALTKVETMDSKCLSVSYGRVVEHLRLLLADETPHIHCSATACRTTQVSVENQQLAGRGQSLYQGFGARLPVVPDTVYIECRCPIDPASYSSKEILPDPVLIDMLGYVKLHPRGV